MVTHQKTAEGYALPLTAETVRELNLAEGTEVQILSVSQGLEEPRPLIRYASVDEVMEIQRKLEPQNSEAYRELAKDLDILDVAAIRRRQADLIDVYGGSHGLRDAVLLEFAVMRAANKVNYERNATVASVAASLSYGLIKSHAFINGTSESA